MRDALLLANVVVSVVSGLFCVVAVVRPASLLNSQGGVAGSTVRFYAWFYALRQLPLSAAVVVATIVGGGPALRFLLTVSGIAQAGDAVLGVRHRNPAMVAGGVVAAVLHLASALFWLGPGLPWQS